MTYSFPRLFHFEIKIDKADIYILGDYQIYFFECVENITIFTNAQHG